jgi:hypothetical protein
MLAVRKSNLKQHDMSSIKMYKTGGYKELIETVEPIKVTEKSVIFTDGRQAKHSRYANYWDTIEEAKEFLERMFNRQIESANIRLEKAKSDLELLRNY